MFVSRPAEVTAFDAILDALRRAGSPARAEAARRNGAHDPVFGASFALVHEIAGEIGVNQELATRLWEARVFEAQELAGLIAAPPLFDDRLADHWLGFVTCAPVAALLGGVVARSPVAVSRAEAWTGCAEELSRTAGYETLSAYVQGQVVDLAWVGRMLDRIEAHINGSPNRARHSMNAALIIVGSCVPELRDLALGVAQRVGRIEVDHGRSRAVTPGAAELIRLMAS